MADDDDITFTILDEATVERLQKRGDIRLPARKINPDKDIPWNMKQLNSKLLQGIIAGDPIPRIRELFSEVIGNNATSTIRAARTMTTSAENRGRLDSYENLEAQGVVQKKVWIATPDDRTREAHLELDGQEVDIDEPFVDMDGNDLMYPGDPDAAPETVWNCRCSMRTHIVGFKRDDGSVSKVDYDRDTTTHAAQIEEEREDRAVQHVVEDSGGKEGKIEYQYHATQEKSLKGIIEQGLKPSKGHVGEGVYFADSVDDAKEWTSETSTGGTTVLRVNEEFLKEKGLEKYGADESGYDIAESVYAGVVPLSQIEIKVGDDEWWSLAQYANQHKRLYDSLSSGAKKKVDKIVDEEWEAYLKRKGWK